MSLWYKVWSKFLAIVGEIRIFKWPCWVVYTPGEYKVTGAHFYKIRELIRPGDILLRGFDSYLDGLFIPGRYSHAAIYVDTDNDTIIHAMTPAVQFTSLAEFIRCDRIAVIRPTVSQKHINIAIQNAMNVIGVPYDYDFKLDEGTNVGRREFFCSELIYHCYSHVKAQMKLNTTTKDYFFFTKTLFTPCDCLPSKGSKSKIIFEV